MSVAVEILSMQAEPFNMGSYCMLLTRKLEGGKIVINKKYKNIQKAVTGGYLKDGVTPIGQRTTIAVDFLALNLGFPLP